jgi:hypothetical protein
MKNKTKTRQFWPNGPKNILVIKKDKPNLIYNLAQQYFPFMTLNCRIGCVEDLIKLELKRRDNDIVVYES